MSESIGSRASAIASETYSGMLAEVRSFVDQFRGIAYDHVKLASLEAKQAGASVATMLVLGVLAAILLLSAWLGLMGTVVLFAVERDLLAGSTALGLAVGVNLVIALILLILIYRQLGRLKFPATARSLKSLLSDSDSPDAEDA
ncbi:MAG TPA: phage holin family protein [Candidatus Competibacter sp.]|nr:phage holin family protein [Candidatus Competibacter sp.]